MHEVSIVTNIFRIVREKMKEQFGKELPVTRLKVVIGQMTTVVPDALRFAFEMVSKDTVFENAKFEIEYVPLKIKCKSCKGEMILDEPFMFCRNCDSFEIEIISGKELYVDAFEVDEKEANEKLSR